MRKIQGYLAPRKIDQRRSEIANAIWRYIQGGKQIPLEWVKEYNELLVGGQK